MEEFVIMLLVGPPWPTAAVFGMSVLWVREGGTGGGRVGSCSVSQIVPVTTE